MNDQREAAEQKVEGKTCRQQTQKNTNPSKVKILKGT